VDIKKEIEAWCHKEQLLIDQGFPDLPEVKTILGVCVGALQKGSSAPVMKKYLCDLVDFTEKLRVNDSGDKN
jgi:hypothetical protein